LENSIAIITKDLVKKFGDLTAVDHLSLEVRRGEVFGFLGPNGAGKSTSINMICCLTRPTQGEVYINGERVTGREEVISRIGLCPQDIIIWPRLTCLEQLVFIGEMYGIARRTAKSRALDLLARMELTAKKNKLAHTLSGGMQRRLNICLALVHNPEIAVLDEPEAGLDPQSRIMVRAFIKEIAREKTVILTTHNMDEAERLSDRVAIIDRGKLLLVDSPDNLKKSIGEGDVLEIELKKKNGADTGKAEKVIKTLVDHVSSHGNMLIIKTKNVVEKIQLITNTLKKNNFETGEIKLRGNTLEDVFIHLTGRRLRE
jgi:ABC-2 type transport system ATP-binding protein